MGMRRGSIGCEPTRWDAKILQKTQIARSRQCRGSFLSNNREVAAEKDLTSAEEVRGLRHSNRGIVHVGRKVPNDVAKVRSEASVCGYGKG